MAPEAIFGIVSGGAVTIGAVYKGCRICVHGFLTLRDEHLELKRKVNIMWKAQVRRGIAEIVEKGMGQFNSPLTITDQARAWFDGMAGDLRAFYFSVGKSLSDLDFMLELENKFGDRILREVCIPNKLKALSCLIIAADVAKRQAGAGAVVLH